MSNCPEEWCLPSDCCVLCGRTLEDVGGGKRIIGQKLRGVTLTDRFQGGGNSEFPNKSVPLGDGTDRYLLVWGEPEQWTDEAIERARQEYLAGRRPWLCQLCGERKCSQCGWPINYPMGSDILHDSGCSTHIAIFPFDPGCINKQCKKYRDWGF